MHDGVCRFIIQNDENEHGVYSFVSEWDSVPRMEPELPVTDLNTGIICGMNRFIFTGCTFISHGDEKTEDKPT